MSTVTNFLNPGTNSADGDGDLTATLDTVERLFPRIAMRLLFDVAADSPLWELPLPQLRALHLVALRQHCSIGHLAERLGVAMSTATQMADRLEQRGCVMRVDDPEDRRVVRLTLTEEGRQLIEQRRLQRRARLEEALARMPAGRRAALIAGLQSLYESGGCGRKERTCRQGSSLLDWVREELESESATEDERLAGPHGR
jgi:DNA-binding MarR family transcriptional regulator